MRYQERAPKHLSHREIRYKKWVARVLGIPLTLAFGAAAFWFFSQGNVLFAVIAAFFFLASAVLFFWHGYGQILHIRYQQIKDTINEFERVDRNSRDFKWPR